MCVPSALRLGVDDVLGGTGTDLCCQQPSCRMVSVPTDTIPNAMSPTLDSPNRKSGMLNTIPIGRPYSSATRGITLIAISRNIYNRI